MGVYARIGCRYHIFVILVGINNIVLWNFRYLPYINNVDFQKLRHLPCINNEGIVIYSSWYEYLNIEFLLPTRYKVLDFLY